MKNIFFMLFVAFYLQSANGYSLSQITTPISCSELNNDQIYPRARMPNMTTANWDVPNNTLDTIYECYNLKFILEFDSSNEYMNFYNNSHSIDATTSIAEFQNADSFDSIKFWDLIWLYTRNRYYIINRRDIEYVNYKSLINIDHHLGSLEANYYGWNGNHYVLKTKLDVTSELYYYLGPNTNYIRYDFGKFNNCENFLIPGENIMSIRCNKEGFLVLELTAKHPKKNPEFIWKTEQCGKELIYYTPVYNLQPFPIVSSIFDNVDNVQNTYTYYIYTPPINNTQLSKTGTIIGNEKCQNLRYISPLDTVR